MDPSSQLQSMLTDQLGVLAALPCFLLYSRTVSLHFIFFLITHALSPTARQYPGKFSDHFEVTYHFDYEVSFLPLVVMVFLPFFPPLPSLFPV